MATTEHQLPSPLAVNLRDGRAVVQVAGDLDLLSTADLRRALEVLGEQHVHRVDVDLRQVPRLDSTAVELLASTHARLAARGGRLAVTGASHRIADLLRRRGLNGLIDAR